jgi:hypothetical protein
MKILPVIRMGLTGIVSLLFIASAMSKFFGGEDTIAMAKGIGLSIEAFRMLGLVELISVILFLIPRTGMIGTMLLAAYMGGAMATHLTHGQALWGPMIIEGLVWIAAVFRFPELMARIRPTSN